MRPPAVADLVIVPDHVRGEALEHLLDARKAPVAVIDVPVPAQHRGFVRQQVLALPAHPAIQEPPDIQSRHSIGVALVAPRDDEIDLSGVAAQRGAEIVPHLQVPDFRALPEQAAFPVGHVAGEERELEWPPLPVGRGRAEAAQAIVAEENAVLVTEMQQVAVARAGSEIFQVKNDRRIGIEVLDGEFHLAGIGNQGGRVGQPQRHVAQAFPQGRPAGRILDLLLGIQQQGELPGAPGAEPQSRAGRSRVAHDGSNRQGGIGPGAVSLEYERVG